MIQPLYMVSSPLKFKNQDLHDLFNNNNNNTQCL